MSPCASSTTFPSARIAARREFARTSMFDVAEPDTSDLHDDDVGWLEAVRDGIERHRPVPRFRDGGRVSVMP